MMVQQEIPKEKIPPDAQKADAMLMTNSPQGQPIALRVHEVKDKSIVVDFNVSVWVGCHYETRLPRCQIDLDVVIESILLDHFLLVTQSDDELVDAVRGINIHDVPENRLAPISTIGSTDSLPDFSNCDVPCVRP